MPKLMVMYPQPTDAAVFDKRYVGEHLPMAGKLLTRVSGTTISKGLATPGADVPAFHTIATVEFPSMEDLQADLGSEGGQAVAAHAFEISTGGPPVMLICEDQ
jgi:uncharacterized protein (TIGR02118 family)